MAARRSPAVAEFRRLLRDSLVAAGAVLVAPAVVEASEPDAASRLAQLRGEIGALRGELDRMAHREQGLLGELERLGAELRLRESEQAEVALRLEEVTAAIDRHDRTIARLDDAQSERRRYLGFRLREIYKAGEHDGLRRWLGSPDAADAWAAATYASYLSRRDADVLRAYRLDEVRSASERQALAASRSELLALEAELARSRQRLEQSRFGRQRALTRLREDQGARRSALDELEQAAAELERVVGTVGSEAPGREPLPPELDVRRFRGTLSWPGEGPVTAGFGTVVHPRFRTEVPHPGLDIDAPQGSDIRAVFDGRVVFAEWMRGYGLTAIVDHGYGVLTIYAHASVLVVEPGERLSRGQLLGKVGDTGSLRGPYLYFELRVDGEPTDPRPWLAGR